METLEADHRGPRRGSIGEGEALKARFPERFGPSARGGLRAARHLLLRLGMQGLLVGAALVSTDACVVTSAPTFTGQADCPPSFLLNEADPPVSQVKQIDATGPSPIFSGTVQLRSCATTKTFDARYFLDDKVFFTKFEPTGTAERAASITVPITASIAPGCHKVELLATTAFAPGGTRTPLVQGDLADIVWFIDVTTGTGGDHPIEDCNSR